MDMERKEEIIQATFMLASKNRIDNVSMSQIATQLGIKKPSLYNHFRSKDEIVKAMYDYLRTQAKEKLKITKTKDFNTSLDIAAKIFLFLQCCLRGIDFSKRSCHFGPYTRISSHNLLKPEAAFKKRALREQLPVRSLSKGPSRQRKENSRQLL